MSQVTFHACDGCGAQLGGDSLGQYHSMFPSPGTASLKLGRGWTGHATSDQLDVCGPQCLLKVARRLNGIPEVDELESAFLAPVAMIRPATRKRTARP